MKVAAFRNSDTLFLGRTPGKTEIASTVSTVVVVDWTFRRNHSTSIGSSTPGISFFEETASSASIISEATYRNSDTRLEV